MIIAVKFYKDVKDAPKGMPPEWPAEVRETSEAPEGFTLMTHEEYLALRERLMPQYQAYEKKYDPKRMMPSRIEERKRLSTWQRFVNLFKRK